MILNRVKLIFFRPLWGTGDLEFFSSESVKHLISRVKDPYLVKTRSQWLYWQVFGSKNIAVFQYVLGDIFRISHVLVHSWWDSRSSSVRHELVDVLCWLKCFLGIVFSRVGPLLSTWLSSIVLLVFCIRLVLGWLLNFLRSVLQGRGRVGIRSFFGRFSGHARPTFWSVVFSFF